MGSNILQVLWAAIDGSSYVWVPVKTQGDPPSPRFHHSSDSFDGALLPSYVLPDVQAALYLPFQWHNQSGGSSYLTY